MKTPFWNLYFKRVIFCVFGVMQCVFKVFKLKKKTLFSTYCALLLLLYASPFWNAPINTKLIILRSEACEADWPAIQCVVIGQIPQVRDGNVTPLTVLWCRVPARWHKNNKTHYKRGIQWDIITDYNHLYCVFEHEHVCICDRRNDKQQAQLYTAQNLCLNSQWQIH